ncbi:tyrosine recombinase XerS [Psychrobacillus sp. FSL K6-2684]|uniref:tyrosine recombinase XerS n=1 Tax=unclassified Psychrobacillus TaxID=2636677 RepID=UPI0030F535AF
MPAPTRKTLSAEQHIERALKELPYYVSEYVRAKKRNGYSPITLSGYLHDYKEFFKWICEEGKTKAKKPKEVPYEDLEKLSKIDVEFFIEKLTDVKIEKSKDVFVQRSNASVTRFIQSLKSLFNYLTTESEKGDGECYFYRNVMAKIKTPKKQETAARRAKRINTTILNNEQMKGFLEFVKHYYALGLSPANQKRFERDRYRDTAIISLFLGSGIRVNELAGLLLTDIDLQQGDINVVRKGNDLDTVSLTPAALKDLRAYLDVREEVYKPDKKNKYVFVSKYKGVANPIGVRTIQSLINKYSEAFLEGKRLSPHKLRHSFANSWLDNNGSLIGLRDQLGHNTIETTTLYTNLSQQEQRIVLNRMSISEVQEIDELEE